MRHFFLNESTDAVCYEGSKKNLGELVTLLLTGSNQ